MGGGGDGYNKDKNRTSLNSIVLIKYWFFNVNMEGKSKEVKKKEGRKKEERKKNGKGKKKEK